MYFLKPLKCRKKSAIWVPIISALMNTPLVLDDERAKLSRGRMDKGADGRVKKKGRCRRAQDEEVIGRRATGGSKEANQSSISLELSTAKVSFIFRSYVVFVKEYGGLSGGVSYKISSVLIRVKIHLSIPQFIYPSL